MTNKLLGPASVYAGSNILAAAIPFLLLPVLTRVLTPADYGIVAMFGIAASLFAPLTGLGTQGAIEVRYFDKTRAELASYLNGCLAILVLSTLATLLATWALLGPLERVSSVPGRWLLWAVLAAAMQHLVLVRLSLWQVTRQAWKYGALQIGQSAANAAGSLLLVLSLGMAWQGRTLAIVLTGAVFAVLALGSLRKEGWLAGAANARFVKDALRFGVPLVPHLLGGLLISAVDRALVTNLLNVAQTGVFTVALQLGMVISLLTGAFNRAYAPWLFGQLKTADAAAKARIVRFTYLYFALLALSALLLGWTAPAILSLLVGKAFQDGASIVVFVACGFAFGGMYFMVTNYVFYAGSTGKLSLITLLSGLVNLVATYAMISAYGLAGAGYGFMVSQAVLFLGTWYLAHRVLPMPWWQALTWRQSPAIHPT